MAEDPYVREIGRITDSEGRRVIVGVNYDTVTLRTLRTRTNGAVELDETRVEELAQLLVAATWQAAWQTAADLRRAGIGAPGADGGTAP
jgi:hypothetical protein